MLQFGAKVPVPLRERKSTERGARKGVILVKAMLFAKCWAELKDKKPKFIKNNFMSIVDKFKPSIPGKENDVLVDTVVNELFKGFFSQSTRVSYLRCFEKMGSNLMFCNDDTIKTNIIQYIRNNERIKSQQHIKNMFSEVYLSFYAIGRERKWCNQEIIIPDYGDGVPIINAGNPLTKEVEKEVLAEFNSIAAKRPSRFMVQVNEGDVSSDDEEQDGHNSKSLRLEKQGLPASVAMIYYVMMRLLVVLFDMILRMNHIKRMENIAMLILLWGFTMHECARPGDTMSGSHHKNLIFWFGEQYPLITLAFVKIETLEYLLKRNLIKKFYFESWKGKTVREYRGRWHCFLPCQYNSLDMAWIYIVVIRALAFVSPTVITSLIFNKTTTNLSEIRRTTNISWGIFNLVMYSIRYAFAEESIKYLLEIPRNWVRYVMGHVSNSQMSQRYANNLNQRVEIDNIKSLLGCDVCNEVSVNNHLPLRFRTPYTGVMNNVPPDTPQHIIDDLNIVKKAIKKVFSSDDGRVSDSTTLMNRVPKDKVDFMAEMKRIPFGTHFLFKEGLLSNTVNANLDKTKLILSKIFGKVDTEGKPKQMIWSYGQVMFGEWHEEEKQGAIQEYKDYKEQKTRAAMDYVIASTELPFPKSKKRKATHLVNTKVSSKPQNINKAAKKATDVSVHSTMANDLIDDNDEAVITFHASRIETGDIVAIVCRSRDRWSIQVPNTSKFVWVCHVQQVELMARKVRICGKFFKGTIDELVYDHNNQQVVDVRDDDVAHIFSGIEQVEWFNFDDDEIRHVVNFCRTI